MKFNNFLLLTLIPFSTFTYTYSSEYQIPKPTATVDYAIVKTSEGFLFGTKNNEKLNLCVNLIFQELKKDPEVVEAINSHAQLSNVDIPVTSQKDFLQVLLLMSAFNQCSKHMEK